jgi:Right handed beta helix region
MGKLTAGLRRILPLCAVLLALPAVAAAQVTAGATASPDVAFANITPTRIRYVSQLGTDNTSCGNSSGSACRTIGYAISHGLQGDEIRVAWSSTPYVESIDIYATGTASQPWFIRGVANSSGAKPKLVPPSSGRPITLNGSAARYWVFDGLEIDCQNKIETAIYLVGSNHAVIKNSEIHHCQTAVAVRDADDVLITNNSLHDNTHFVSSPPWRYDGQGVTIEHGSARVEVSNNVIYGSSGDALQCQGREQEASWIDTAYDPVDIKIIGNNMHDNLEQGIDIKSCARVTISGNEIWSSLVAENNSPPNPAPDQCAGDINVIHYSGRNILFEYNRVHDMGRGLTIGNEWGGVNDVIIQRNQFYNMNQDLKVPPHESPIHNCGDGINIHRAKRVDIYHNTFDNAPHSAIRSGTSSWYNNTANLSGDDPQGVGAGASYVRIFNNIIANVDGLAYKINSTGNPGTNYGGALELNVDAAFAGNTSNYNYFWEAAGAPLFEQITGTISLTVTQYNFADWKTNTSHDLNSVLSTASAAFIPNPQVNGYYTVSGSSARNAGQIDTVANGGSNQRCNGAPDIGALESDCTMGTPIRPNPIVIHPGPPNLTVHTSAAPNSIYGGPNVNGVNESSVVTITVQNLLTLPQSPHPSPVPLQLFGSEARGVSVSVSMPALLSQVGNMVIPSGFQCAVAPNNHYVFCWGGTIPAGDSVVFQVEIIGAYSCGYTANVQAVADPYNWISETSETNNDASSGIFVYSIC